MTLPQHSTPRSLESRIFSVYQSLSPMEKQLADLLLQFQMELPSYSAGELAARAGVSKATAARLFRTLGYASYPEAKRQIRAEQHWGSPLADITDLASGTGPTPISTVVQMDVQNIATTVQSLSEEQLSKVIDAFVSAPNIWIMGLRSGYGLAHQAGHNFSAIRRNVHVISGAPSSYSLGLSSITSGDVLLVVAFRRRPRILPEILSSARELGAVTVLITDLSASASARAAEHVLRCRCQSPSPINSFVAALTLINYFSWALASRLGNDAIDRFKKVDNLVERLDDVSKPA